MLFGSGIQAHLRSHFHSLSIAQMNESIKYMKPTRSKFPCLSQSDTGGIMFKFQKFLLFVLIAVFVLSFAGLVVVAQDETPTLEPSPFVTDEPTLEPTEVATDAPTPEPTPEVTATPIPPVEEPPPDDSVRFPQGAFIIAVVVAGVLLTLFGAAIRSVIIEGIRRIPTFIRPGVYAGVESVLGELERIAKETVDTADDEQLAKFRREWERIKGEVDGNISRAIRRR